MLAIFYKFSLAKIYLFKKIVFSDNPEVFRTICVPGYGVTCDEIQGIPGLDCNPKGFLSCWNSQCLCTFPEQQIYLGMQFYLDLS